MPEEKRPDIRPQLRELLAWYEEVLGRIDSGAIVEPGEQERLTEEASAVAHLLDLLDSRLGSPPATSLDAAAAPRETPGLYDKAWHGTRSSCRLSTKPRHS